MGRDKKAQRTKGNRQPASSGRTASKLEESPGGAAGLIGFSALHDLGYVPAASQGLNTDDSSLNAEFRVTLRKMMKKDSTTKIKALQEFETLCVNEEQDSVLSALPFWPRLYCKLAIDVERRVREACQVSHGALCSRVGRHLAPHLRAVMPTWCLAMVDPHTPAASAANRAFKESFSAEKRSEVLIFSCKEIMDHISDNLFVQTAQTLSDPKNTEPEDMNNKYIRVQSCSFLAFSFLMKNTAGHKGGDAVKAEQIIENITPLIQTPGFWKFAKNKHLLIRHAFFSALCDIFQYYPKLLEGSETELTTAVLPALDDQEGIVLPRVWEAFLHLCLKYPDLWNEKNSRSSLKRILSALREGGRGSAEELCPYLLPILSILPPEAADTQSQLYTQFFAAITTGLMKQRILCSSRDICAIITALYECLRYVANRAQHPQLWEGLIKYQIINILIASFKNPQLSNSNLYRELAGLLRTLTKSGKEITWLFWNALIPECTATVERGERSEIGRLMDFLHVLKDPRAKASRKREGVRFYDESEVAHKRYRVPQEYRVPQSEEYRATQACRVPQEARSDHFGLPVKPESSETSRIDNFEAPVKPVSFESGDKNIEGDNNEDKNEGDNFSYGVKTKGDKEFLESAGTHLSDNFSYGDKTQGDKDKIEGDKEFLESAGTHLSPLTVACHELYMREGKRNVFGVFSVLLCEFPSAKVYSDLVYGGEGSKDGGWKRGEEKRGGGKGEREGEEGEKEEIIEERDEKHVNKEQRNEKEEEKHENKQGVNEKLENKEQGNKETEENEQKYKEMEETEGNKQGINEKQENKKEKNEETEENEQKYKEMEGNKEQEQKIDENEENPREASVKQVMENIVLPKMEEDNDGDMSEATVNLFISLYGHMKQEEQRSILAELKPTLSISCLRLLMEGLAERTAYDPIAADWLHSDALGSRLVQLVDCLCEPQPTGPQSDRGRRDELMALFNFVLSNGNKREPLINTAYVSKILTKLSTNLKSDAPQDGRSQDQTVRLIATLATRLFTSYVCWRTDGIQEFMRSLFGLLRQSSRSLKEDTVEILKGTFLKGFEGMIASMMDADSGLMGRTSTTERNTSMERAYMDRNTSIDKNMDRNTSIEKTSMKNTDKMDKTLTSTSNTDKTSMKNTSSMDKTSMNTSTSMDKTLTSMDKTSTNNTDLDRTSTGASTSIINTDKMDKTLTSMDKTQTSTAKLFASNGCLVQTLRDIRDSIMDDRCSFQLAMTLSDLTKRLMTLIFDYSQAGTQSGLSGVQSGPQSSPQSNVSGVQLGLQSNLQSKSPDRQFKQSDQFNLQSDLCGVQSGPQSGPQSNVSGVQLGLQSNLQSKTPDRQFKQSDQFNLQSDLQGVQSSLSDLQISPEDSKFSPIQSSLQLNPQSRVQSDVSGVQSGPQSDVSGLQSNVSGLQSDVSGLQSDVSGLQSNVSGMQSDVSGLQSDVSGLQSDVSGLQSGPEDCSIILDHSSVQKMLDVLIPTEGEWSMLESYLSPVYTIPSIIHGVVSLNEASLDSKSGHILPAAFGHTRLSMFLCDLLVFLSGSGEKSERSEPKEGERESEREEEKARKILEKREEEERKREEEEEEKEVKLAKEEEEKKLELAKEEEKEEEREEKREEEREEKRERSEIGEVSLGKYTHLVVCALHSTCYATVTQSLTNAVKNDWLSEDTKLGIGKLKSDMQTLLTLLNQGNKRHITKQICNRCSDGSSEWCATLAKVLSEWMTPEDINATRLLATLDQNALGYSATKQCLIAYLPEATVLDILAEETGRIASLIEDPFSAVGSVRVVSEALSVVPQGVSAAIVPPLFSVLSQWRDNANIVFVFATEVKGLAREDINVTCALIRLLTVLVKRHWTHLEPAHWDLLLCSLSSWVQSLSDTKEGVYADPVTCAFACAVSKCVGCVAEIIQQKQSQSDNETPGNATKQGTNLGNASSKSAKNPEQPESTANFGNATTKPGQHARTNSPTASQTDATLAGSFGDATTDSATEASATEGPHATEGFYATLPTEDWVDFFAQPIYNTMISIFVETASEYRKNPSVILYGVCRCVCIGVCGAGRVDLEQHSLPPVPQAEGAQLGDAWKNMRLPPTQDNLLSNLVPLLTVNHPAIQCATYSLLNTSLPKVIRYWDANKVNISEDEDTPQRPLPPQLMQVVQKYGDEVEELWEDKVKDGAFTPTLAYLLAWRLILSAVSMANEQNRHQYTAHLRDLQLLPALLFNLFNVMPKRPVLNVEGDQKSNATMFNTPLQISPIGNFTSKDLGHLSCKVYYECVSGIPAAVRQWFATLDRQRQPQIESFTATYVSPLLIAQEMSTINASTTKYDNMIIRTRPLAREVVAAYSIDQVSGDTSKVLELTLRFSRNHPLSTITVENHRRVGVSLAQWRNWLLGLNTMLQHRNTPLLQSLGFWRQNVEQKFRGLEECYICYYVLHGSNHQLPKLQCRTCKKKFHSACLYKWFSSSNNSTCPLCRSLF